jgi:hypothetical protein
MGLHDAWPAHIAAKLNTGGSTVRDCTVLDISESGARIAIETPQDISDEFTICLTPSDFPLGDAG